MNADFGAELPYEGLPTPFICVYLWLKTNSKTLSQGEPMSELPTGTVTFLFSDIGGTTQLLKRHREAMKIATGLAPED